MSLKCGLYVAILALLWASPAWSQTIAPKPLDGPLATAIKNAAPRDRAALKAAYAAAQGKLSPWTYGKWTIEMKAAPVAKGVFFETYVRALVAGKAVGLESRLCEWSHIRVRGPPVRVPDGTKREETDPTIGVVLVDNFKEDVAQAIRLDLGHTVSVIATGKPAVSGRICNTVSTFYPDAHVESTSVDGWARRSGVDEDWATLRAGAGTAAFDSLTTELAFFKCSATTDQFTEMRRAIILFDTSGIDDGDTLDSAVLSVYGIGQDTLLGDMDFHVSASTPASNTAIVNADYSQLQTTSFGSIASASWVTGAYNDVTLNASGEAAVDFAGISKFGGQTQHDINNTTAGIAWQASQDGFLSWAGADTAGTTNDPKLVVTHSVAASGGTRTGVMPGFGF